MLKRLLFETRIGDLILALIERLTGLAVVELVTLHDHPATVIAKRRWDDGL